MLTGDQKGKLEEIFRAIDTDDSGYIDPPEFKEALQKLVGDFPDDFLQGLMNHFDTDGDGRINLEELLNLLAFVDQNNQLEGVEGEDNELVGDDGEDLGNEGEEPDYGEEGATDEQ